MKTITQFQIRREDGVYIAEGTDLGIVTDAADLDTLVQNIEEAVSLYFEGENAKDFGYARKPSVLVNYELPQYA
jgi:predicted RNase H-like HicB family nuclease